MDSQSTNSGKSARRQRQAAIARKKAIIAAVLVAVMAVLWMRVFAKKGKKAAPAKVTAATVKTVNTVTASRPTAEKPKTGAMEYKQLPMVAGRNDVLVRDIFSKKSWIDAKAAVDAWNSEKAMLSDDIRRAGQSLKLEAILMGESGGKSEIFIDDKLVPEGSDFPTRHAGRIYRFTVENVTANKVILKCRDVSIVLKLSEIEG